MAMTMVEAAKYSNDVLQVGIIEKIVKDDPILERIPWKDIQGNGLTYNVETTLSGADWYNVGDTWVESTSEVTQSTAVLRILGGDADVDNFLKATRGDQQDLMSEQIQAKTKAMKQKWGENFYYGYNAGSPKEFDGLHVLIADSTYNSIGVATDATTETALSMAKLDEAVDRVKGGKPDLIIMSKQLRRNINKYLKAIGGLTGAEFQGKTVQTYLDIPIAVSDYIKDTENCDDLIGSTYYGFENTTPDNTDDTATSVFVLRFGPEACCGLQNAPIQVEHLGSLETKDAERVRIKWYCSIMLQQIISCGKVSGIKNDTAGA